MKKRKILKLFGGISSAVALCATSSVLLTSCASTGSDNKRSDDFTDGMLKPLNIRFAPNTITSYPLYPTPENYPILMAPNFEVINQINETPLPSSVVIDPNTGWPTEDTIGNMSYQQFFMNKEVATYMAPSGDPNELFNLDKLFQKERTDFTADGVNVLDLKNKYLNDDYADETVKAFNCPYFYNAYVVGQAGGPNLYSSINSCFTSIDLSNNNLWYIPFFGYNSMPANSTDPFYYLFKENEYVRESTTEIAKVGFTNLQNESHESGKTFGFNLENNQLTTLPYVVVTEGEWIERDTQYDLTNFFPAGDQQSNSNTDAILIDGNCISYDVKDTSIFTTLTKYHHYNNPDSIVFNKDDKGRGFQSYAIYNNTAAMYDEIIKKCCLALNETKDQFLDRSLGSYCDTVQELSPVLGPKLENGIQYKLGDCLNQLVMDFLNENNLASAYIYTKYEMEISLIISVMTSNDFIYDYPSYSTNTGSLTFSLQLGAPRICKATENGYTNEYGVQANSYFVAFSLNGFDSTNWMAVIVAVICSLAAAGIIFVIIYYTVIRKRVAAKRKAKDLAAIAAEEKQMQKGGK